jgi:hypothetical protein
VEPSGRSTLPKLFFCGDELLDDFGDDFVLGFEPLFEEGDPLLSQFLACILGAFGRKGLGAVFKEGLLPEVKQGGVMGTFSIKCRLKMLTFCSALMWRRGRRSVLLFMSLFLGPLLSDFSPLSYSIRAYTRAAFT